MRSGFLAQEGTLKFYTSHSETMPVRAVSRPAAPSSKEALVRQILERIADKWTLLVIDALDGSRHVRFSRLRQEIGGISQKMLTKTLRQLERDGLVTRRIHAEVPPRVDYRLTPLGESLGESVCGVWSWVEAHRQDVERCRRNYDGRISRSGKEARGRHA
jgi:DNA-binding HxlR family transcriptional regulator